MKKLFATLCAASLLIGGCVENSQATSANLDTSIIIEVNGKTFTATLEDNLTAKAFVEMLPLECDMKELNSNEKYFYLNKDLPNNPAHVRQIHAGDLMLFGSNCLVLFYEDFSTSYSYTRLGKVDKPADLSETLGSDNVYVRFNKEGFK